MIESQQYYASLQENELEDEQEDMDQERLDVMGRTQPQFPVTDYLKKITTNSLSMSKSKSTPKLYQQEVIRSHPKLSKSFMASEKKHRFIKIDYLETSKDKYGNLNSPDCKSMRSPYKSDITSPGHPFCSVCPAKEFISAFLN